MEVLQAFILGIVQGITEFLPISSSGHLILFPWLFGWDDPGLAFSVWLHFGTLVAVIIYFWSDLWPIFKAGLQSIVERQIAGDVRRKQFWFLFWATLPAVFAGLLLHDYADSVFRTPTLVAFVLALVGFLLYLIDGKAPQLKHYDEMTLKDSLLVGLAQALAIIPGTSRSGITMLMGRAMGLKRDAAAKFSFLLSVPIILGAVLFEGIKVVKDPSLFPPMGEAIAGFLGALVFGWLSIHWLLGYVRSKDYAPFAWYRIALAALIIVLSFSRGI